MELEFQTDFDAVKSRWDAFWRGENTRPMIGATLPREGVDPQPRPRSYELTFGEFEPVIDQVLRWAETHDFLADTIPSYQVSFAADHFAALLGAEIVHNPDSPDTHWLEPFVEDWDDVQLTFQRDGYWWERTVECIRAFREKCDGKLVVVGTHLEGGLDALSAVRGPRQLLFDLIECPEKVKRALKQVETAVAEVYQAQAAELDSAAVGTLNRFGMYCSGMLDVPQCDFSCMISRGMFNEFQLPAQRAELENLDHSIYHLDGPGAVQHLEALCSLERLDMIQWQPGAGNYDEDWSDLYQRIDDLGKGQFRWLGGAAGMQTIRECWRQLKSRKQYFKLGGISRAELDGFLESF